jgi:hypothetical protein
MHRALIVLVAAVLFSALVKASIAPTNPANVTAAKSQTPATDVISVDGLHVFVPNGVQHFPSALLPQP